mmetsp:Transcript_14409/g.56863  ORF Transcript_14409/g.56863 Transcript_14409/m.56863 type:complete len:242 (-) Transcript_14409:584-1309(-)
MVTPPATVTPSLRSPPGDALRASIASSSAVMPPSSHAFLEPSPRPLPPDPAPARNAMTSVIVSIVRPATPVPLHTKPTIASCTLRSLSHLPAYHVTALTNASPAAGPSAATNGGTVNNAHQRSATVYPAEMRHTLAAADANHSRKHAFRVVTGRSHRTIASAVIHVSAATGALAAALAATHPPNLAANRRTLASRFFRVASDELSIAAASMPPMPRPKPRLRRTRWKSLVNSDAASAKMNA